MTSSAITLLVIGILGLAVLAFGSCAALIVHHATSEVWRRRHERRVREALLLLAPSIVDAHELGETADIAVKRFGRKAVADVLRRARNDLAGGHAVALSDALERIGEVSRLQRLARSGFTSKRRTAVRLLGECGGAPACEALARALADPEWEVRRAARDGLLADGSDPSIRFAVESYLAEEAKGLGWRRSFYARFALVAPDQLCALIRDRSLCDDEEKHAIDALGHARAVQAVPLVRPRLRAADPELRASAARFAGKLADAAAVAGLVPLLADPQWFVRAAAARALETVPTPLAALAALGACLQDGTWWVRSNAARTLARTGDAGRAILAEAIDGADAYARDAAITALATQQLKGAAGARHTVAERPDAARTTPC